jgi:antitoxin ChpS
MRIVYSTSLRRVGGSVMLSVPPAILNLLHLKAGSTVGLEVEGERLVVAPRMKPQYTMDQLLAECDPEAARELDEEDRPWLDLLPVGREL